MNIVESLGHFQEIMSEYPHMPAPSLFQVGGRDLTSPTLHFSSMYDFDTKSSLTGVVKLCTWAKAFGSFCYVMRHSSIVAQIDLQGHPAHLTTQLFSEQKRELERRHRLDVLLHEMIDPSWLLSIINADIAST